MIPSHIPDYFSQANDFEINSCQKSSRECSAATSALLCFLLQMLYDDEPGVEDVSCGLSLKKKLGLMVVSPISFSLQFCMLSGVLKSISSWQLVKSQRPPQKASSTPLVHSLEEEEEHHFSEKKPAPLDRLPAQVQYCPTYYIKDSIDPDNVTLT